MAKAAVDREFCRGLPKVELHAHLTGSISRKSLQEVWTQKKTANPDYELEDPSTALPANNAATDLKTDKVLDSQSFFPLFSSYIYKLCNDLFSIKYTTKKVLQEFEADNVVYLELRTTPRNIPEHDITFEVYVRTVLECIAEHNKRPDTRMRAKLILSVDRRWTVEEAEEVVDLAIKFRGNGVVAVDLCGDPAKGDVSTFSAAFAKARSKGLRVTLHFAETPASSTDEELTTLLDMKPDRLGHVIHVKEEYRKKIVELGIGVELCLSCNIQLKMTSGGYPDHHFGWWRNAGGRIALCTDDVGIFGSPLSEEYYLAATHFNLQTKDIKSMCESAIKAAFTTDDDKRRLTQWIHTWYQNTVAR